MRVRIVRQDLVRRCTVPGGSIGLTVTCGRIRGAEQGAAGSVGRDYAMLSTPAGGCLGFLFRIDSGFRHIVRLTARADVEIAADQLTAIGVEFPSSSIPEIGTFSTTVRSPLCR